MKDNIQEEHLLIDVTKTDLQNDIKKLREENELIKDKSKKDLTS
jgi:hypothetical protein